MTKFIKIANNFRKEIGENHIGAYASSCAFFIFLSMIPSLMLLCSLLPYTNLTMDMIVKILREILPQMLEPAVANLVYEVYNRSIAFVSISALGALWSAGKGVLVLVKGLNVVQKVEETRGYFFLRIQASLYTLVMLIAVIFSLMIIGLGQYVVNIVVSYFPHIQYLLDFLLSIRVVFMIIILEITFIVLFTWLPNCKMKWRYQIPGAMVVSLGWTGISFIFSFYVGRFAAFSIYGSMTTIIVLMLWLYMGMYIVMLGALVNKFLEPATNVLIQNKQQRSQEENNL